jgi:hypothetical protein
MQKICKQQRSVGRSKLSKKRLFEEFANCGETNVDIVWEHLSCAGATLIKQFVPGGEAVKEVTKEIGKKIHRKMGVIAAKGGQFILIHEHDKEKAKELLENSGLHGFENAILFSIRKELFADYIKNTIRGLLAAFLDLHKDPELEDIRQKIKSLERNKV